MTTSRVFAPSISGYVDRLTELVNSRFSSRLFAHDASLWGPDAESEAQIRLGWTDVAARARETITEATALRDELAAHNIDHVVLCGMGGSSLAPLVIAPALTVLDSTHPDAVREALSSDLSRTVVVVSSKSGGTVETLSHRAAFAAAFTEQGIDPAGRIVVVTDPGSALEASAQESGQRVFLADPNVGGRFSALTAFGIVPSVLSGADVVTLVEDADAARSQLGTDSPENPALQLAASLAAGLPSQYVLEVTSDGSTPQHFGLWIEQLIAESTGKNGTGVLPIALGHTVDAAGEPSAIARRVVLSTQADEALGDDLTVSATLGAHIMLWEVATSALGRLMGIDPFNQPDVEAAKIAARELLGKPIDLSVSDAPSRDELLSQLREIVAENTYLGIQAFAYPNRVGAAELLEQLRSTLSHELDAPVAAAWGPRYLHSTGQLHKGGPATAAFLQFVEIADQDLDIPGGTSTFGDLIAAQSHGDATVLRERGRNVVTLVTRDLPQLLRTLL